MQPSGGTSHEHDHAGHVMPDGTVMEGAHHGHAGHAQHAHPAPQLHRGAEQGVAGQVEYTCPMHPQVRQFGPGNCPICGMALEPVMVTAETGDSPELRDMTLFYELLNKKRQTFSLRFGPAIPVGDLEGPPVEVAERLRRHVATELAPRL